MKHVDIYTDGACSGNPGPGGYGIVMVYGTHVLELSRGFIYTTNNKMELLSVITALNYLKEACDVTITSDSKYVVDGIEKGWAKNWKKNGWIKGDKKPAKNPELWDELLKLLEKHHAKFVWVKGHADNPMNLRCDDLAVMATQRAKELNNDELEDMQTYE